VLAAFVTARAWLAFVPSMAAWGLNAGRFLPPAFFWSTIVVSVLALVPAVAAGWTRLADRIGDAIADAPAAYPVAAIVTALFVAAFPDRTWFVGDFQIRVGAAEVLGAFAGNFQGAMPLDHLMHGVIAGPLSAAFGSDPTVAARIFGAAEAAAIAMLAVRLARLAGARGAVALMMVVIVVAGGDLATFTGLGKPASEMCLITASVGVLGVAAVRDPRALLGLGVALAAGLLVHRSAVLLLPAFVVAWVLALRGGVRRESLPAPSRARVVLALAIPVVTAVIVGPRIARLITGYDLSHHFTPASIGPAGPLAAALDPARLADIGSMLLVVSPALLAIPIVAFAGARPRRRETGVLMILALSTVPVWLFVRPQQGVFRDWDVFAPSGMALMLLAAWGLGLAMEAGAATRRLAWAVTVIVFTATLGWLALAADADRGLMRVRAWLTEPPLAPEPLRAAGWDFVAGRALRLGRYAVSEDAARRAVELAPHRRTLLTWGIAATMARDEGAAANAYRTLLEHDARDPLAWLGLGGVALRTGDSTEARRALDVLEQYPRGGPEAREIRRHLAYFPEVWPGPLPANLDAR
jgi:hypothetical protein